MRVVFMGTPDFAVPTLEALVASEHEVICVVRLRHAESLPHMLRRVHDKEISRRIGVLIAVHALPYVAHDEWRHLHLVMQPRHLGDGKG